MTVNESIRALDGFGLTPRQAAFVSTVALHGGYCLRRHYCTFAGIPYGKNVRAFLDGLVMRQLARRFTYRADRGHLYHLHGRAIYRALRQEDNRNRRQAGPALIARKLMLLDFVLSERHVEWYATERDKVELFVGRLGVSHADLPQRAYASSDTVVGEPTTRYFLNKLPIYLAGDPPGVHFVYLATDGNGRGFEQFVRDHARLLGQLPRWSIVAVCPAHISGLDACRSVFDRLRMAAEGASLSDAQGELRWYFVTRRTVDEERLSTLSVHELNRFRESRRRFAAASFDALYHQWLLGGDSVLEGLPHGRAACAVLNRGSLETRVLHYGYEQFGALPGVC